MFVLVLYLLLGPLAIIWAVTWFLRKYTRPVIAPGVARLAERRPMEPKTFRLVCYHGSTEGEPDWLGDFEDQPAAVDAAYAFREKARAEEPERHLSLFVLNDKGEFLEEVDA